MCPLPTVSVEIDGKVVSRLRAVRVLINTDAGVVACFEPMLWPGEHLVERPGRIPMIIKDKPCTTAS